VEDVERVLTDYLADEVKRRRMGEAACVHVQEHLTWRRYSARMKEIVQKCMREK
jgi:hypothetical protein